MGARVPEGALRSVALLPTAAAAAVRRGGAAGRGEAPAVLVASEDLREPVRAQQTSSLVVLAVDASGSMGADRRMQAAKGAVLSLLVDAYQRRDRVALVTFGGDGATVVLRPTGSVEVARARLESLATGGPTPLAAGIARALEVAESAEPGRRPLLVVVSDGRATAGPDGIDPFDAAMGAAAEVRRRGVPAMMVDAESGPVRLGLALELAMAMGAHHLDVGDLTAADLAAAVRAAR